MLGSTNDANVRRKVEEKRQAGWQVFLVIQAASVDNDLLREVGDLWPSVNCFLHDPGLSPDGFSQMGLDDVSYLEPELTSQAESDAFSGWGSLMELAGADLDHVHNGSAFQ